MKLLLKNHNFSLLWVSQVLSQAGSRMYIIAVLWWLITLKEQTSGSMLSIFMIASVLPSLLFLKKIGKIIDQHKAKRILQYSDIIGTLLSLILLLLFQLQLVRVEFIFIASFIYATCQAFINPTINKSVQELVDREDIDRAVAFVSSTETIAYFAGALLGAILIAKLGIVWIILLNGLSYFFSLICDSLIKFKKIEIESSPTQHQIVESKISVWNYLNQMPLIKTLIISFALINFFGPPVLMVLPVYVKDALQMDSSSLALLESSLWVGLLFGTFISSYISKSVKLLPMLFVTVFCYGFSYAIPAFWVDFKVYFISLFIGCSCLGILNVRMLALFQKVIDHQIKGRFFAFLQGIIAITMPISYLVFGILIDYLSAPRISLIHLIQGIGIVSISFIYIHLHIHLEKSEAIPDAV